MAKSPISHRRGELVSITPPDIDRVVFLEVPGFQLVTSQADFLFPFNSSSHSHLTSMRIFSYLLTVTQMWTKVLLFDFPKYHYYKADVHSRILLDTGETWGIARQHLYQAIVFLTI